MVRSQRREIDKPGSGLEAREERQINQVQGQELEKREIYKPGLGLEVREVMGSCHLGNSTFGKLLLGEMPLGNRCLGKCL